MVLDIDPNTKSRLYAALDHTGTTLKDWFLSTAESYLMDHQDLLPFMEEETNGSIPQKVNYLADAQKLKKKRHQDFSVVSLFSGCGGMDLGFKGGFSMFNRYYSKHPFDIIWANDLNEAACATYRRNIGHHIQSGDVWKLVDQLPSQADVIIGGFPCQDISVNGKRAGANGARSGLYRAMIESIKRIQPRIFVAENVKGLLMPYNKESLRQIISDFNQLGYTISYQLYRAADYSVPQNRERVFIVGTSSSCKPFVPPKAERNMKTWMSAEDALQDLEALERSPEINHIWSLANASPEQGNRKLTASRPAHTIRAECHGNIQFHYRLPRRLSMREAARIQTFPDNFIFEAKLREMERQIGNAVPPVLAWHIAASVADCLL